MVNSWKTPKFPASWVCNFGEDEIPRYRRYVQVARRLGYSSYLGIAVHSPLSAYQSGFYINHKGHELTTFWDAAYAGDKL